MRRSAAMSPYRPLADDRARRGEGTRMRSTTPKVLHHLCGRPMLAHVIDSLSALPLERVSSWSVTVPNG